MRILVGKRTIGNTEISHLRASRRDLATLRRLFASFDDLLIDLGDRYYVVKTISGGGNVMETPREEIDWLQRQPEQCYFYPGRDCPGWQPGGTCARVDRRIPMEAPRERKRDDKGR